MADVLPPFSQPASTITMLHSRPSSADAFQSSSSQYSTPQRPAQAPRSMYNGQAASYRSPPATVQPYAFQSTPHLRQASRSVANPSASHGPVATGLRHKHAPSASGSTTSSDASSQPSARDDSVMGSSKSLSAINLGWQLPDVSLPSFEQPAAKASPERYRRPVQKRGDSNSTTTNDGSSVPFGGEAGLGDAQYGTVDDLAVPRPNPSELAKRYRRRSLNQLDTTAIMDSPALMSEAAVPSAVPDRGATSTPTTIRPVSLEHDSPLLNAPGLSEVATSVAPNTADGSKPQLRAEPSRTVQVPARGSSEPTKRLAGPSPLSKQADDSDARIASPAASPTKPKTYAAAAQSATQTPSAAAAQLAALSDKDLNKGMKSRLRRAFSFGSAQELRRAAGENNQAAAQQAQQTRQQHQQNIDEELDAEQLEIARRQEAAGFGAGIYSGQGGFSGSTDNLSISSTASSASMMLRKMGRGAKKGAKSIKGLFRPKSVIGVPAADGPLRAGAGTLAEVSRVTVEAERQVVNVNAHAEEMVGGGTGFPKLERNSLDAAHVTSAKTVDGPFAPRDSADSPARRSIVGGEKDRAEVLAAVKKGILKRSGTASPTGSPVIRPSDGAVPHIFESPAGSTPTTPLADAAAAASNKGRSSSMTNAKPGDYFVPRASASHATAKSVPNTPNGGSNVPRNISFNSRIQFHDVWSSSEYDRRSEVATCNRLTPLLAQQIKEELNTFKMEMEVHELSKPHTHFF